MRFNSIYNNIIKQQVINQYPGHKTVVLAGSFRVPYKYDLELIDQLKKLSDEIIIDISGISSERINRRPLSKLNLQRLAGIFSKGDIRGKFDDIIKASVQNMSYRKLKPMLLRLMKTSGDVDINKKIQDYMTAVQSRLYQSLDFYKGIQVSGETVKGIFQELTENDQCLKFIVSKQESPVYDAVEYINQNFQNSMVILVSLDRDRNESTWNQLKKLFRLDIKPVQYFPQTEQEYPHEYVLEHIDDKSAQKRFYSSAEQYNIVLNMLEGNR